MQTLASPSASAVVTQAVVTQAVLRAAAHLGLSARILAKIIGLNEPTLSHMTDGGYELAPGSQPFELSVLFIRMFRSLDTIAGGNSSVASQWMTNNNSAIGACPVERIQATNGLSDVIAYLEARRAPI